MPFPHIYTPLFDLFHRRMGQHFPSVSRRRMTERFESGTMSQFLANCICALGARFTDEAKSNPAKASAPFIAKAQELITPLLHLPTSDICSGLLILSWACYGQGSESGLWQFSGMSIRMAIDLGFHEQIETYESPAHLIRTRLLFWSMFVTDRIIAFATGRPASIPEDVIEIPLPEDSDFYPDPANDMPTDPVQMVEPVPFVQLTKLMVICGRISNVLNGRRGRARTLVNTSEPLAEQLAELQVRLVQFVSGLPNSLQWSVENFKHQQARGHGVSNGVSILADTDMTGRVSRFTPVVKRRFGIGVPPRTPQKPIRNRNASKSKHVTLDQARPGVFTADQRMYGVRGSGG